MVSHDIFLGDRRPTGCLDAFDEFQRGSLYVVVAVKNQELSVNEVRCQSLESPILSMRHQFIRHGLTRDARKGFTVIVHNRNHGVSILTMVAK
jgi:hypothetical protein